MMNLNIDKTLDTPLYIQIRDKVTVLIKEGALHPGDKLPPVTSLAKEIGVTQATIRRAFEDLKEQGYTECHVGRGTFITLPSEDRQSGATPETAVRKRKSSLPIASAAQKFRNSMSQALQDIMTLADKPGVIKLTSGVPDPSLLSEEFMNECISKVSGCNLVDLLDTDDPQGNMELRDEIARRTATKSTPITAENILITNGSLQACSLLGQAAIGSEGPILFETPCYTGMAKSFAAMGHWVTAIPRDEEGPEIQSLDKYTTSSPSLFYLCPWAHNPMGTDLSGARSDYIAKWVKKSGCTVIADEIFKDLRYSSSHAPTLLEKIGLEQLIVISSLSKTVSPGLRVGWVIGSVARIRELASLKRVMDYATPPLMQHIGARLLSSGTYEEHIERMRRIYQKRMEYMLELLDKYMPKGVSWTSPDGGFSLFATLPAGYSSISLFFTAIDKGVAILPGPVFDLDQRFINSFRLSCAWTDHDQLKEGIELLSDAVTEILSVPAGDLGLHGLGSFQ